MAHDRQKRADRAPMPGEATLPLDSPRRSADTGPNRRVLGIALIIIGCFWLSSTILPNTFRLPFSFGHSTIVDRSIEANRLVLDAGSADVQIQHWKGPGIHVRAVQSGGNSKDITVNLEQQGDTLQVNHTMAPCFLFCQRDLTYYVELPDETPAAIQTSSGDIDADTINGGIDLKTTRGNIELKDIGGQVAISTTSGNIELDKGHMTGININTISGNVDFDALADTIVAQSISGNIQINNATASQLHLNSTSGTITYNGSIGSGEHQIDTISGNIVLHLPDETNLHIDASTISGHINNSFTVQNGTSDDHNLHGSIGSTDGNQTTLTITSTSGNIRIQHK